MLRYKTETRPGLVALYDIRPRNGAGPFLQPRSPHGARTHGALDSERDQQKNKHHIFAPTAGAHCAIFPKLCMSIELVVPIIKVDIHFLIQRIDFPRRCTEKFGLIYRRAVSQQ